MTTHKIHKIRVKITNFFNNTETDKKHFFYKPNYLSSDDDDYYQPDIFAPYTQEYRVQQPRSNLAPQKYKFLSTKLS